MRLRIAALSPRLRRRVLACVAMLGMVGGLPARASTADSLGNYDINEGPADRTLIEYAQQSREASLSVLFPTDVLSRFTTNPLHGQYRADEALNVLLRGTGLSGSISSAGVVTIIKTKEADGTMKKDQSRTSSWIGGILAFASTHLFAPVSAAQGVDATPAAVALEEIVVTGSRVITNGNNSPTPVTIVQAEDALRLQPSTIADALNVLPVFSGPRTQVSNPNASLAAGTGGNAAANQLNLRNLGSARTLILFDGHRAPPTSSNGVVDVDMFPQMLLQRVDVVTGGASAVYGSDAITGVVNFITDRNFTGLKTHLRTGISEESDGRQYEAGVAYGTSLFDGRGHFEASYEFRDDEGILFRSSRQNSYLWTVQGTGTASNPYYLTGNTRRSDHTFGGLIRNGALAGQHFASNGVLSNFVPGAPTGTTNTQIGGDGAYFDGSLKAPLRSHQLFGRFDYDFTDDLHGYVEVAGNDKRNELYANWQQLSGVAISRDNGYLPTAVRNQIPTAQTTFTFGKFMSNAPRLNPVIEEQQVFVNAGLEGSFGDGYKWDAGYTHSSAELNNTEKSNLNNYRLSAALDATVVTAANVGATGLAIGSTVCNVALTNPGLYPGCVPLNVFGPTSESPESIAYILGETHFDARTVQDEAVASISGAPFSTWAGPLNTAVSAEWRKQSYEATSDATPTDPVSCTGLRLNCNPSSPPQSWFQTFANRSTVSQTVWEGAVEFDAPLLTDVTLAKSLNLNGAARYTDYDTSGGYTTWKLGMDWHMNDQLRVRATRSRDIRAPTLDDLFSPAVATFGNVTDVLFNTTSNAPSIAQGNPELTAEIGDTTTAGIVFRPDAIPGFSMALDFYDITVSDAISQIQGTNSVTQNACYQSGGASPYCALIVRPLGPANATPGNNATAWLNSVINIAEVHTQGADFELNYATSIASHALSLRGLVTYQPHVTYETPGLPTTDMGGVAFGPGGLQAVPVWRATGFLRYGLTQNLAVDLMTRWRSTLKIVTNPTQYEKGMKTDSVFFTNLNISYRIKPAIGDLDIYFNVQNLFNQSPPPAGFYGSQLITGQFGGFAIGDDPIGRYYTLGLRYRM